MLSNLKSLKFDTKSSAAVKLDAHDTHVCAIFYLFFFECFS